jgi:hypothetical protein
VIENAVTVIAMLPTELDGLQAPWPYSPVVLLGLFVGIPAAVFALVVLAVFGASWTRSGRTSADYSGEATWLSSPAASVTSPAGPGAALPPADADTGEPGGSGARW